MRGLGTLTPYTVESPCINGPAQFKHVLVKSPILIMGAQRPVGKFCPYLKQGQKSPEIGMIPQHDIQLPPAPRTPACNPLFGVF